MPRPMQVPGVGLAPPNTCRGTAEEVLHAPGIHDEMPLQHAADRPAVTAQPADRLLQLDTCWAPAAADSSKCS